MTLTLEPVRIAELFAQVVQQNQPLVRERRQLQLQSVADPSLPLLWADPRRLRQVLQNLVSNALKFTARGEIALRARAEGAAMIIDVEDTGMGISAVELPRIFEEYRQAGGIAARRGGSGLGLAICKRIVESHHGQLSVDSEMGRGTRFTIALPLQPPASQADPAARMGAGSRP
jgi:signal transduction histidine kinase